MPKNGDFQHTAKLLQITFRKLYHICFQKSRVKMIIPHPTSSEKYFKKTCQKDFRRLPFNKSFRKFFESYVDNFSE
jgi:hypothetical protein